MLGKPPISVERKKVFPLRCILESIHQSFEKKLKDSVLKER